MIGVNAGTRSVWKALLPAVVLFCAPLSSARALDKTINVVIDKAHLVDLPPGTATLIIGNPTIADVTMIGAKNARMILTPKAFGETNFIALDTNGLPLTESIVRVVAGTETLTVQRGMERQSYACAPKCQSTEKLGDDSKYFMSTMAADKSYSSGANSSMPPTSGSSIGSH